MDRLAFRVLRNDGQIGTHVLTFSTAGGMRVVRVATDIRVGLGPVTLYRYTHRAEERWARDRFEALDAETNDNGTSTRTTARREEEGLRVEGPEAGTYLAPAEALPMTHWTMRILETPLISPQSGKLLRPTVTRLGRDPVLTAAGAIPAERFALRGDPDLDTWYDAAMAWAGLRLTARDGSTIRYERE